jgi:hypothetical protein
MRLQSGLFPDPMHDVFADTQDRRQLRQPQCVDPSPGLLRVADKILARKVGVSTLAD